MENHPAPHGDKPARQQQAGGGPGRIVEIVAGDFLLTVNPVDGSEIESCPPGRRPISPRRRPAPDGGGAGLPGAASRPLLEREEERERLTRLLTRGRSVRLTGARGTGRTSLLAAVAADCADLAPDGVISLSGHRRNADDLLQELYAAVHQSLKYRPGPTELRAALREIGAVVILDDLEFGGQALQRLLTATPECAYLMAATPEVPAPSGEPHIEEVALSGLSRTACLEMLETTAGRPLTGEETDWAADLWFESEGLPLRFLQAGAVLRAGGGTDRDPIGTLAGGLDDGAREALRIAVALGGELPGRARLSELIGEAGADGVQDRLLDCGLVTSAGGRHRLASGVTERLTEAGYDRDAADRALTAAQHYTWWLSEPAASPWEVAGEGEALVAVVTAAQRAGHAAAVTALARTAAPLLAASLRWGVWERVLRSGQESARTVGEVAQQAYFHHELGVLAVCQGQLDRARAELEASIALRGVLADTGGAVAGRRALALVDDLTAPRALPAAPSSAAGGPLALTKGPAVPPASVPDTAEQVFGPFGATGADGGDSGHAADRDAGTEAVTEVIPRQAPPTAPTVHEQPAGVRRMAVAGARRNAVAAGAGVLLAAVLGTVVTLGMTSGEGDVADDERPTGPTLGEPDSGPSHEPAAPTEDETEEEPPQEDPVVEDPVPTEEETSEEPVTPSESSEPTSTRDPAESTDGGRTGGSPGGPSTSPTTTPPNPGDDEEDPGPTEDPEDPTGGSNGGEDDEGGSDSPPSSSATAEPSPTATTGGTISPGPSTPEGPQTVTI